jgi:hypothetical protein
MQILKKFRLIKILCEYYKEEHNKCNKSGNKYLHLEYIYIYIYIYISYTFCLSLKISDDCAL